MCASPRQRNFSPRHISQRRRSHERQKPLMHPLFVCCSRASLRFFFIGVTALMFLVDGILREVRTGRVEQGVIVLSRIVSLGHVVLIDGGLLLLQFLTHGLPELSLAHAEGL